MNRKHWRALKRGVTAFAPLFLACALTLFAQSRKIVWSEQEAPIYAQLGKLRSLGDAERAATTKQLAIQIRELPDSGNKGALAEHLAGLATEGDPGRDALQEVATTLAQTLRVHPMPAARGEPAPPYITLAELVRFEHVQASVDDPQFAAAMAKIDADEKQRQNADFTLIDLQGTKWTRKNLKGRVVLVNFWATWCGPCRKEMPDLEALYQQFKGQGLVVLAIDDDENESKVRPFIAEQKYTFPILLDEGGKTCAQFRVVGIPKSLVYDRNGKLVAQAMDMRTRKQFLEMLALAGIE